MIENATIKQFIEYLKSTQKSQATLINYRLDLMAFEKWFIQHNKKEFMPKMITEKNLCQYKTHLLNHPFKPKTINRHIGSLRSFINWLSSIGEIKNKLLFPKRIEDSALTAVWLNKDQQYALMHHLERYGNDRDTCIVCIFMNTGISVQEFVNLTWIDVTLTDKNGSIIVRHSKTNKYREIPLNKDAHHAFLRLGFRTHTGKAEYILQGQQGRITVRGVQMMIKRRVAHTSIHFLSPHILRHTFCKNLVDAGVSLEKIALLAGHKTLETTKIYCSPSPEGLMESVELIGRASQRD